MSIDEFVNKYNGKPIDFDGAYGAQCWDLAAQYSREVVGVPGGAWQVMPTGPNGGASEVYTLFQDPLGQYYDRIANSPDPNQVPQKGDLVIWGWAPYGHIALCLGATSASITVFEENSPIGSVAHVTPNKTWSGVLGWIRPKSLNVNKGEVMNNGDVVNMYRVLLGREPDAGGLATFTGMAWHDVFYSLTNSAEYATRQQQNSQVVVDLRTALQNEQNKPPKEVIKEVEKIVNVPVEVIKEVKIIEEVEKPYTPDGVLDWIKANWRKLIDSIVNKFKKGT